MREKLQNNSGSPRGKRITKASKREFRSKVSRRVVGKIWPGIVGGDGKFRPYSAKDFERFERNQK